MKKIVWSALCIPVILALCACSSVPAKEETEPAVSDTVSPAIETTETPVVTPEPAATPVETTPTPAPSSPEMYSSYAHLVSFDPNTGAAQFDYFEILQGDKAVDYLVEHKGYTEAEAQSYVADWADSEFIEKNLNDQLRTVDIDDVSLSLMYQPSGAYVEGVEPVPSTASDFRAIYKLNPSLLLDSYFFYIHVESDGHISLVEQVYWA